MSTTRRRFLKGTAVAGLEFAWGGLRLFAGQGGQSATTDEAAPARANEFIYGAHVYRPPNPPRAMRREVLRTIAQEHGFGLIRCFPTWDYYNAEPGKYDFSEVEEVMGWCDEFGLKVMMGVVLETAPAWLEQAHPETRYVDAKGQTDRLMTKQSHITGGWPGLCLDWKPVQEAARQFIGELAKVVVPHRSMYVWDVWNEPHIEPVWTPDIWATPLERIFCYCEQTLGLFRAWLKQRYGSIERLNEAWTRKFSNWETVEPPRALATSADWVDWRRFMTERSTWDMHFRIEAVRAAGSMHLIESHCAHQPPFDDAAILGTNGWRLAECVDVWGMTFFPHQPGIQVYEGAGRLDIVRSNAAGKDFWWTELQGGDTRTGMLSGGYNMRPRDIRLWNWLGVAAGAKGIIYWQYMAESTGRESTRHGLVLRDNVSTDRVREAARANRLIQKQWSIIKNHRPRPQVAMLFDQDNALLTFALAGDETASCNSFRGYYRALWKMDLWADFIEPAKLAGCDYKAIIVPLHWVGKQATCDALLAYVKDGGTLIIETAFGLFDERFYYNPVIPPHGLAATFGYREKQNSLVRDEAPNAGVAQDERIYYQPEIEFTEPVTVRIKAHTFLTPLEVTSATVIGSYQGLPVAVKKKVGRGEIYYFGTNLGGRLEQDDPGAMQLLRSIVERVAQAEVTATGLRPRLVRGERQSLLMVFNDTTQDQTGRVALPAGFKIATDIYAGKVEPIAGDGIEVTVPYEDVVVLLLA
jgi:beta-galactosidase